MNMTHALHPAGRAPRGWSLILLAMFAMVASPTSLLGQMGAVESLSTWGMGEATARPSRASMSTFVQGQAELADDALVMYRDAKRRAMQAIEELEIEGLSIVPGGLTLGQQMDEAQMRMAMGGPGGAAAVKPQIVAREPLQIVLTGIDAMEDDQVLSTLVRLINTLQDAGLPVSGMDPQQMARHYGQHQAPGLFLFEVEDTEALATEARRQAVASARARASKLAEEAGVTLGPITALHESQVNDGMSQMFRNSGFAAMYGMGHNEMAEKPMGMTLGPITYRVRVMMNFAISTPGQVAAPHDAVTDAVSASNPADGDSQ